MKPNATLAPSPDANFSAFCAQVARAYRNLPPLPRAAAPSLVSSEGVGADGGYLAPPEFRDDMLATLLGEDSLLGYCLLIPTRSHSAWLPVDAAPPWTASGVTAQWDGEGVVQPPSEHPVKPALAAVETRLFKQSVLVPLSGELYEDAPSAGVYLGTVVRDRMVFKLNQAILNGSGVGQPAGVLQSGALITLTKEGAQAAATVLLANVKKMWARLYGPSKRRAVWIANVDVEPFLDDLAFPLYIPAGAQGNALPLLKGRPVIFTEAAPALGQKGDIVLADLGSYAAAVRVYNAVKPGATPTDADLISAKLSLDVWFDVDLAALKFTMRAAGRGVWNAPIARTGGQPTVSTFVTLEAR
jgi:HK97 family phage major capsid protein